MYQIIYILTISFLFTACSSKITIKSLYPSKVTNTFESIKVEKLENDLIKQTSFIKEKIFNKTIDSNKIFKISNTNYDVILRGKVLKSDVNYYTYYETYIDYSSCKIYNYNETTKKYICTEYTERRYPCENQEYIVKTYIEILSAKEKNILFSKTYKDSERQEKCYRRSYYFPYFNRDRDKEKINPKLALNIADKIIKDIAPHYEYFKIEIIEKIKDKKIKLTNQQNLQFKNIIYLLKKQNFLIANKQLILLNDELNSKSWEILYNLAISYEATQNLIKANTLFKKSRMLTGNFSNIEFINKSINRTNIHIINEKKAKLQLE